MATDESIAPPAGIQDLRGMRFNRLVIWSYAGKNPQGNSLWDCRCDCGRKAEAVIGSNVKNGSIVSCGCYRRERTAVMGRAQRKHGMWDSPEYGAWQQMRRRCYNPRCHAYLDYGGRGIRMCDRWRHSFENFLADMGTRPTPKHSIDRIDNDGNYSPENCRWATRTQQLRNTRASRRLTFDGVTKTVAEWVEETGLTRAAVLYRHSHNKPLIA